MVVQPLPSAPQQQPPQPTTKLTKTHILCSKWMMRHCMSLLVLSAVGFSMLVFALENKLHMRRVNRRQEQHQKAVETSPDAVEMPRTTGKSTSTHHRTSNLYQWKPLSNTNKCTSLWIDPFAPSFESELYEEIYGKGKDFHHYVEIGRDLGYECTRGQHLKQVFSSEILPQFEDYIHRVNENKPKLILEIGPFLNPMLIGKEVKYFDIMPLEELQKRAEQVGYPSIHPIEMDYVHPHGDLLAAIPERNQFALIASSNVLPNQVDLVRHLQAVGLLLVDGGYYVMTLSDKRRMFDYFLPTTDIAQVLSDYYDEDSNRTLSTTHRLKSIIEHRALTMSSARYWASSTTAPFDRRPEQVAGFTDQIRRGISEYETSHTNDGHHYVDVHNYHFTPQSLALIVDVLYNLRLIDVHVHRLYETLQGSSEFGIVLKKCSR